MRRSVLLASNAQESCQVFIAYPAHPVTRTDPVIWIPWSNKVKVFLVLLNLDYKQSLLLLRNSRARSQEDANARHSLLSRENVTPSTRAPRSHSAVDFVRRSHVILARLSLSGKKCCLESTANPRSLLFSLRTALPVLTVCFTIPVL